MSRLAKSKTIIRTDEDGNKKVVSVLKDDLDNNSVDSIHIKEKAITKEKLSEDMTGASIGKSGTGTKSEIFNDYTNNVASSSYSHAEGDSTLASGYASHAEGQSTAASGDRSHAEGNSTTAFGESSHAEGFNSIAGQYGYLITQVKMYDKQFVLTSIEGLAINDNASILKVKKSDNTIDETIISHSFPITKVTETTNIITTSTPIYNYTWDLNNYNYYFYVKTKPTIGDISISKYQHAEGWNSIASGFAAHAEGKMTTASGPYSHAEGLNTTASGRYSHAEGKGTTTRDQASHAEGWNSIASDFAAHAEGDSTTAGYGAHAEGGSTTASATYSHAEGYRTITYGGYSHAEGDNTLTRNTSCHAEGSYTYSGSLSFKVYTSTQNSDGTATYKVATDKITELSKNNSVKLFTVEDSDKLKISSIFDIGIVSSVDSSAKTITTNIYKDVSDATYYLYSPDNPNVGTNQSVYDPIVLGKYSHAEGEKSKTIGHAAHAEGKETSALNQASHAEGYQTTASGIYSHAEGDHTIARGNNSHVQGKYNVEDTNNKYADIIGNGSSNTNRSNAYTLDWDGNAWFAGNVKVGGTSYDDTNAKELSTEEELERLQYYGDKDIVPSDESYFTVNETGETITGLTDEGQAQSGTLVIPYKINGKIITTLATDNYASILVGALDKFTKVILPNTIKTIGGFAFDSCTSLTSINIPDSVTSIDSAAFQGCTSLESITIPNSVTSIGSSAFGGCTLLKTANIPNSITRIGMGAFSNCPSLTSINIPNSVTAIGESAFSNSSSLTSINIPNSVTAIGENAFHVYDTVTNSFTPMSGLTIYCEQGSYADTYAKTNGFNIAYTDIQDEWVVGKSGTGENSEIFNDYTNNVASRSYSHAEGYYSKAYGQASHAEGFTTQASGHYSHAEGQNTKAYGDRSHAEGYYTKTESSAEGAHAEGYYTTASGAYSHAEGDHTKASKKNSHAEGASTTASGEASHAEGSSTVASGNYSHAEGNVAKAYGANSHAEGNNTIARGNNSHVQGKYNVEDTNNKYADIIGNGSSTTERSNAATVDWNGNAWYAGDIKVGGTSYDDTNAKTIATENYVIDNAIPYKEAEGVIVNCTDCSENSNILDYRIYGNSVQETRSGKNLITYPYYDTTKTVNGITFTDNGDGTITANGTATDSVYYILKASNWDAELPLSAGTYTLSGCPSGGSISTFVLIMSGRTSEDDSRKQYVADIGQGKTANLSDGRYDFIIAVYAGATLSNAVFKPQLEKGSTATSYEQYGAMPSPNFPSEIKSVGDLVTDTSSPYYGKYDVPVTVCGKNLFDISKIQNITQTSTQEIIQNNDGTLTVHGTAVNTKKTLRELCPSLKVGDEAILSFRLVNSADDTKNTKNRGYIYISIVNSTWISGTVKVITDEILDGFVYLYCRYAPQSETITTGTISEFQIELGATATPYEPYSGETKHIYLDEPLRKVGDYADYVDFQNQKVVRNVKEKIFDGTENWSSTGTNNFLYIGIDGMVSSVYCFSTHYIDENRRKGSLTPYLRPMDNNLRLYQNSDNILYSSADEFKTFLANQNTSGNPLIVDYILATPTEEPITAPELNTVNSNTAVISSSTTVQPSNMYIRYYNKYYQNISNKFNTIDSNLLAINPKSWKDVQRIVRSGLASHVFNIGDQLTTTKGSTELVWDIIGIDHDTPADPRYTHSLTLQLHDCLTKTLGFDTPEATWYIDAETYPSGLVAGTYYFTLPANYDAAHGGGSTFNFTLTKDVPVGGQVRFHWLADTQASACSIYTYSSVGTTTTLETVSVVEGESGTAMPTIATSSVTNNTNSIQRTRYGSNNWATSSIRQWLNTDKAANTWWEPKTVFARPSTTNLPIDGFLKDMDPEFLSVIGEVTKTTQQSISDGYGLNISNEKIFLLSKPEVYGGAEYSTDGSDGIVYPYYDAEYSDLTFASTSADTNRIKNKNGSPSYWWLRTPSANTGHSTRIVNTSLGLISTIYTSNPYGVVPACVII